MKSKYIYTILLTSIMACGKKNSSNQDEKRGFEQSYDVRQKFFSLIDKYKFHTPTLGNHPVNFSEAENPSLFIGFLPAIEKFVNLNPELPVFDSYSENPIFAIGDTGSKAFIKNSESNFFYYYFECTSGKISVTATNQTFSNELLKQQMENCSNSGPVPKMLFEVGQHNTQDISESFTISATLVLGNLDLTGPCEYTFQNSVWQPTGACSAHLNSNQFKTPAHLSTQGLSTEGNGTVNLFFGEQYGTLNVTEGKIKINL